MIVDRGIAFVNASLRSGVGGAGFTCSPQDGVSTTPYTGPGPDDTLFAPEGNYALALSAAHAQNGATFTLWYDGSVCAASGQIIVKNMKSAMVFSKVSSSVSGSICKVSVAAAAVEAT